MASKRPTLGNRFVAIIKKRIGELTTEYEKASKDSAEYELEINENIKRAIIKALGLPKSKVSNFNLDTITSGYDKHYFTIGKARLGLRNDKLDDHFTPSRYEMINARAEINTKRNKICNDKELLFALTHTTAINSFKKYAAARFGTEQYVVEMNDKDFKALVADYIETKKPHTCSM